MKNPVRIMILITITLFIAAFSAATARAVARAEPARYLMERYIVGALITDTDTADADALVRSAAEPTVDYVSAGTGGGQTLRHRGPMNPSRLLEWIVHYCKAEAPCWVLVLKDRERGRPRATPVGLRG